MKARLEKASIKFHGYQTPLYSPGILYDDVKKDTFNVIVLSQFDVKFCTCEICTTIKFAKIFTK